MGDVFIQHDAIEYFAVFNFAAGDLLDLRVAFDIYFFLAAANIMRHCSDGL